MKLKRLHLQNFRCFNDLEIELDDGLTVIVGGNGSGKTSVLDAMVFALSPILTRLPFEKRPKVPAILPADIRQTGDNQLAPFLQLTAVAQTQDGQSIVWDRTKLRDQSPSTKRLAWGAGHAARYSPLSDAPDKQRPKEMNDVRKLYRYVDHLIEAHNAKAAYELPVFAFYSTNRAVNVPHNRQQKRHVPRFFSRLAGLENVVEPKTDFRRAVAWFDFLEQRELREARDLAHPIKTLPTLDAVREAIRRTIPNIDQPRIDAATGRFAVTTKDPGDTPIRLHLDQLSDGYQIVLGVVMDFALRLALASPPEASARQILRSEAILIIDEIDLHLHPSWQQHVIEDLQRAFPGTQLIVTTHSPQVVSTVPSQCLRILKDGKIYASPAGTDGAEAQRILEDVFLTKRRPDTAHARELGEYLRLVDDRKWSSARALELRSNLDTWSQGQEPQLHEADLQIENLKWETGQ